MANKDRAFGLRPVRVLSGEYYAGGQNKFTIASSYGTAIYQGDIVAAVTAGNIERIAAGGSGYVLGVFNGCFYTDPNTSKPTWSNKYPASTAASDIVAFVTRMALPVYFSKYIRARSSLFVLPRIIHSSVLAPPT